MGRCPWCGSTQLYAEFVDIGVGSMQVTPYECCSCDARQFMPDDRSDFAEENRLRWWVGCHHDDCAQSVAVFAMCLARERAEAAGHKDPPPAHFDLSTPNIDWEPR
jgi:hypothetical protein